MNNIATSLISKLKDPSLAKDQSWTAQGWVSAGDGNTFAVLNPATGECLANVASLATAEIESVVSDAEVAQREWKARSGHERAKLLRAWFDAMVANADDLATIMTMEQGKPWAEARGEVLYAASFVEWFSEEAKRVYGDVMGHPQSDKRIVVVKQPVGVCAAITPWNFPAAMITRKVAPAFGSRLSIIVRPASLTPLTAVALAVLAEHVGIPAGVFQLVTG